MDDEKALAILKKFMIDDLIEQIHKRRDGCDMIITDDEAAALLYVISSIGFNTSNSGSDDEAFYYRIIREMQRWEVKYE